MIDVALACGWRVVGTTERPRGVQVLDAEGEVVQGIKRVAITIDPVGFPAIQVEMYPKLESGSMDPPIWTCEACSWQGVDHHAHIKETGHAVKRPK